MHIPFSPGDTIIRSTVAERTSVLMFESDRKIGESLTKALENENFSIIYATNAQQAISLLSSITVDAIVIPNHAKRGTGPFLWEEIASILANTTALYVTVIAGESKPTGHLAQKVRSVLEQPCSAKIIATDVTAFLQERRESSEKRRWDRISVLMDVQLKFENTEILNTVALNLGLGGFFVALPTEIPMPEIGSHITYEFQIPGVPTLKGASVVQWNQETPLSPSSPQARGLGCEFVTPEPQFIETLCRLINALASHHVPKEFCSIVKAKDLAAKAVRLLEWLGSHKIILKEGALTSEQECVCFEPVMALSLTGFLLGFCETQGKKAKEMFLDFSGNNHAGEFKVEINEQSISPDTIAALKESMPALFIAAGGKESLHMHHINLDFVLRADTLAIVFRFPTRGP